MVIMGMVYLLCFVELYELLSRQRDGHISRGLFMNKPHSESKRWREKTELLNKKISPNSRKSKRRSLLRSDPGVTV
jgi:hypothetical protein